MLQRTQVRFGIVGCGRIAITADDSFKRWSNAAHWLPYSHASAISSVPLAELVALCDIDAQILESARKKWPGTAGYTDLDAMLRSEDLDAVVISTRTPGRHALIERCAASGVRAIIAEKPLCNSLKEASLILEAVSRHNVILLAGMRRRYMQGFLIAQRVIRDGEIGQVRSITVNFPPRSLLWDHPHTVDLLQFFANDDEVDFVQASLELDQQSSWVAEDPVLRFGVVGFRSGITGHIISSNGYDVEVNGSLGRISVRGDGATVHHRRSNHSENDYGLLLDESSTVVDTSMSGLAHMIHLLCTSLLRGDHFPYSVRIAVQNIGILLGFVLSHQNGGRRVKLDEIPPELVVMGQTAGRYA